MLKILLIGVVLAVLQQWSGINVIFNYAEEIFRQAGYGVSSILFNIVITGAVNLVFTFVAIRTVDRFGRRALMLVGCAGIAFFHTLIGVCYLLHLKGLVVVIPVLATIACYAFSLAPDHLGADLRDLPQPHPRRRGLRGHVVPLGRLLHPDLYVSPSERGPRPGPDVLALCRDLRRRVPLHQSPRSGDERQNRSKRSNESSWIKPRLGRNSPRRR